MALLIKNGTLVTETGAVPADLRIEDETIQALGAGLPTCSGDQVIDAEDLDRNGDGKVDARDAPDPCGGGTGPIARPPLSEDPADPGRLFEAVTPGGYPFAFTNPFVVDRGGDGLDPPGVSGPGPGA